MTTAAVPGGYTASPKDPAYGARGDGEHDDTEAINLCLASNRAVDFGGPENAYLITGTLLVTRSDTQVVTGRGARVLAGRAVDMMRLENAAHTATGLVFEGNGQASGLGLVVGGSASGSTVDGCIFTGVAGAGVRVEPGAHHTRIVDCTLRRCGLGSAVVPPSNAGIDIVDASYCTVLDNNVVECASGISFSGSNANSGIGWFTCRGNTVTGPGPVPATTAGIALRYVRGGRVADNTVAGFAGSSIDCFGCSGVTIAGNTIHGGQDGVFVGGHATNGITIAGNVLTGPQRGVRVSTDIAGALVIGVIVSANTVVAPTEGGVLVSRTGNAQVSGVSVIDNELHIAGDGGLYGVKMVNADSSRVDRNRIYRPLSQGVYLDGVDIVQVTGNTIQDASYTAANTYDAVYVTNAHHVITRDTLVYGSAAYAVRITGGTGMTVSGTRWRSLDRGGLYSQATNNNVYFDNRGFLPTVRVMPLGDSITEGTGIPGGYRIELWKKLLTGGYQVDFVGSQNNGPDDLGDHDHEGHPGWRIDQIHDQIPSWLQDARPRTALLHIGTNDVLQAYGLATAPTRLAALVDRILGAVPYLELFVATIGPLANTTYEANATVYNAGVRNIVAARASTGRVHLVDMHAALSTIDLADGVHPNATGYAKMAAAWYSSLLSVPRSLTLPPASAG